MEKSVWIDEESRILAFCPFEKGKAVRKGENVFWEYVFFLMKDGYRVM